VRLTEIEFALDAPPGLVLQFAAAKEFIDEVTFGLDQQKLDFVCQLDQLFVMTIAVAAMLDGFEPVAVKIANRSDDGFREPTLGRHPVETLDRPLNGAPSGLELLAPFGLLFAASGMGETERAGHGGQRQAFAD
jgi:hypothetical protein